MFGFHMFSHFSFAFGKITDPHLSPISNPHHLASFPCLKLLYYALPNLEFVTHFYTSFPLFFPFSSIALLRFALIAKDMILCPQSGSFQRLTLFLALSPSFRPAPSALSVACAFDVTSSFFNGLRVTCANRTKHCSSKNRRQRFFPRRSHVLRKSMPSRCFSCGIALAPSPRRTSLLS